MATIALYADKINQMPGLIRGAKSAVSNLNTQLGTLKRKCQRVSVNVCNIEDVINTISVSTRTQEEKIETLETFCEDVEEFTRDTVTIDENVAELVNKNKDDFYDKYSYLKPDCEKIAWEKFCDGLKRVGEWCKEHWKALATIVLVVAAVAIIVLTAGAALGPVATILLAAAKGVLIGTAIGGLAGGIISAAFGKSFWEGFEDGAFGGAISGMFSGILTGIAGKLTLLKSVLIGAGAETASSVVGDIGDIVFGVEDITLPEFIINTLLSAALGGFFSGITFKLPKINISGLNKGRGSWAHVWATQSTRSLNHHSIISIKTILKGFGADFIDSILDHLSELFKNLIVNFKDLTMEQYFPELGGST